MWRAGGATICTSYVKVNCVGRMLSSKMSYEEAVQKLNTLQSNKATLDQVRKDIQSGKKCTHLEEMELFLKRTGVSLNKLDELSVIHIAGTKGKGSTSAMCESILRHHGFKTGFFSSPHLVVVRERIRLNGKIIDEEMFTHYFSDVYNKLSATKAHDDDMPKYFHFLTVMALNVFLKEKVNVAVMEVGIGGIVDSTNIVRNPPVVGITALGLDHTSVLGNTIEEIARAKAGIMKPGCEAYTVNQPPNAMAVLESVAKQVQCPLYTVPDYRTYNFSTGSPKLPIDIDAYNTNASLAIQLAHAWLRKNNVNSLSTNNTILNSNKTRKRKSSAIVDDNRNSICNERVLKFIEEIPPKTVNGLSNCFWPGRYQRMDTDFAELFMDGAHTKESLEICADWFKEQRSEEEKTLIFSATGDRNSETLLKPLANISFNTVFFVVPVPYKDTNEKSDTYSVEEHSKLWARCQNHVKLWRELTHGQVQNVIVHECISDVFISMKKRYLSTKSRSSVLVTGSLYLVGGALSILDSNLYTFGSTLNL